MNELDLAFIRAFQKQSHDGDEIRELLPGDPARTYRVDTVQTSASVTASQPVAPTSPSVAELNTASSSKRHELHTASDLQGPHHHLADERKRTTQSDLTFDTRSVNPAESVGSVDVYTSVVDAFEEKTASRSVEESTEPQQEVVRLHTPPTDAEATKSPIEAPATTASDTHEPGTPSQPDTVIHDRKQTPPAFCAAWEVDSFQWPSICHKLLEQQWLTGLDVQLASANRDGLRVMAVTGLHAGEGRTTLSLCLARSAAQAGVRVGLIDADFSNPQLATKLGVAAPTSWLSAIRDGAPPEEAAVYSAADEICVFPLSTASPKDGVGHLKDMASWIEALTNNFDMLIIDAGAQSANAHQLIAVNTAEVIDAVTIVRDMRRTTEEDVDKAVRRIQLSGIEAVGIVENFSNGNIDSHRASA